MAIAIVIVMPVRIWVRRIVVALQDVRVRRRSGQSVVTLQFKFIVAVVRIVVVVGARRLLWHRLLLLSAIRLLVGRCRLLLMMVARGAAG